MTRHKMIFWDFDGTLGYRPNGMWGASMLEALKRYDPDTKLTAPSFREFLISGFPWHHPEKAYLPVRTAEEWWDPILRKFASGYRHYGIPDDEANKLAITAKEIFLDVSQWSLFEDVEETLSELNALGWKQGILSNHVPELTQIVSSLGIMTYFDCIINSAEVGYEKPNPELFKYALNQANHPDVVWMIGDNIEADVVGAERLGWKAILVRNRDQRTKYNCIHLKEVIAIIESSIGSELDEES